uniref:Uncharacterized protein n=1 Tax=Myotis myotis TaxID=51298 RepID=A0A7J7ZYR1_MYOMY|nr:hypothetical protein mMyoMyo1_010009 [Myotis myotis]
MAPSNARLGGRTCFRDQLRRSRSCVSDFRKHIRLNSKLLALYFLIPRLTRPFLFRSHPRLRKACGSGPRSGSAPRATRKVFPRTHRGGCGHPACRATRPGPRLPVTLESLFVLRALAAPGKGCLWALTFL